MYKVTLVDQEIELELDFKTRQEAEAADTAINKTLEQLWAFAIIGDPDWITILEWWDGEKWVEI